MPTKSRFGAKKKAIVCELVAQGYSATKAAAAVGVTRNVIRREKQRDPEFAEALDEAYHAGLDPLVDEAWRRAVDGVEDFRLDKEGVEHPIRVYSDNLLMFLVKQRDPSFRENHRVELTGGAKVEVLVEHEFPEIAGVLERVGLLPAGARAVLDAPAVAVLPARADGEADGGAGGAPPAAGR